MVEETFEPGMTVSLVARRHGVAPNQGATTRLGRYPVGLRGVPPGNSCVTEVSQISLVPCGRVASFNKIGRHMKQHRWAMRSS
jgi:hypothetical protein